MNSIEETFGKYFSNLNLLLPEGVVEKMEGGTLRKGSTRVTYSFGTDERGKYMAAYASNRFVWGGQHARFYENGHVEELPGYHEGFWYHKDATPEEKQAAEDEMNKHNAMVSNILSEEGILAIQAKGFREAMRNMEGNTNLSD